MLNSLNKYGKYKDLINIRESENIISIGLAAIMSCILYSIHLYEELDSFYPLIEDIISVFMSGYIGMIGFSLSGMAIMLTVFSRKQIETIEECNGQGEIEKIMSSYIFLSFLSALNTAIFLIIRFVLASSLKKVSVLFFWTLVFCILYLSFLNIFYAVALVANCVSLFEISKLYPDKINDSSGITNLANNIKTDYVLGVLVRALNLSRDDVMRGLESEGSTLPKDIQKSIMEYFERHYPQA